jgi:hypothetical protein
MFYEILNDVPLRVIKEFNVSEAPIANLFAKHKKIEEQRSFLQKRPINIAIGTPNRIGIFITKPLIQISN